MIPSYTTKSWQTQYYHLRRFNVVIKLLEIWEKSSYEARAILDIGCGRGTYLKPIRRSIYIGCDIDHQNLKKITKRTNAHYVCADANQIPFKDNFFDLVLCSEVLEHLDVPLRALKEIIRVCKKLILQTFPDETIMEALGKKNPEHVSKIQPRWIKNVLITFQCKIIFYNILYFFLPCETLDKLKIPVTRSFLRLANSLSYYLSLSFLKRLALTKTHVLVLIKKI